MNPLSALRRLAPLVVVIALTTTGCASKPTAPTSAEPSSTSSSAQPSATAEPEPVSEPAVQAGISRAQQVVQEISGIVSWEVQPGPGVNNATAKKIGQAADAFIDEHLLRPDRWQGKYAVKRGEMDVAKTKVTASMFKSTSADIAWFDASQEKWGTDTDDWPRKQRDQSADHVRGIGGLFITQVLANDGKGPIRNEMKRKVIYTSEGKILTYTEITGRRANNTGGTKSVTAKLTMKKVDGRWLVDGVHWEVES